MVRWLRIDASVYFLGALWLLILPLRWALGAMLAAAVHELFHFAAVTVCGGQVLGLRLSCRGACMQTTTLKPWKEALCALAGPVGSFSVLVLSPRFPEAALWGLVQGLYNLLPIWPLDGGRVLRCICPVELCEAIEMFALILVMGFGIYLAVACGLGVLALFPGFACWMLRIRRKIPCKETKLAVQ